VQKATIYTNPSLTAILTAVDCYAGRELNWKVDTEEGAKLLAELRELRPMVQQLPSDLIQTIATPDANEYASFLANFGTEPELGEQREDRLYSASIIDVLATFKVPGTDDTVETDQGTFPAVRFDDCYQSVIRLVDADDEDSACIFIPHTHVEGVEMVMVMSDDLSQGLEYIRAAWANNPIDTDEYFEKVVVPMLDAKRKVEDDILSGAIADDFMLGRSLLKLHWRMNSEGVRAQVMAEMEVLCLSAPCDELLIFNRPFTLALVTPTGDVITAIYVGPGDWKNPENLDQ